MKTTLKDMKRGVKGVENVYTQHKSYLHGVVEKLIAVLEIELFLSVRLCLQEYTYTTHCFIVARFHCRSSTVGIQHPLRPHSCNDEIYRLSQSCGVRVRKSGTVSDFQS